MFHRLSLKKNPKTNNKKTHLIVKHYFQQPKCSVFKHANLTLIAEKHFRHKRQHFKSLVFASQLGSLNSLGRFPTPITPMRYSLQTVVNLQAGETSHYFLGSLLLGLMQQSGVKGEWQHTRTSLRPFQKVLHFIDTLEIFLYIYSSKRLALSPLLLCLFHHIINPCIGWGVMTPLTQQKPPIFKSELVHSRCSTWGYYYLPPLKLKNTTSAQSLRCDLKANLHDIYSW